MEKPTFKEIPPDLYRRVEPEAGTIRPPLTGRYKKQRPVEQFEANWSYLCCPGRPAWRQ